MNPECRETRGGGGGGEREGGTEVSDIQLCLRFHHTLFMIEHECSVGRVAVCDLCVCVSGDNAAVLSLDRATCGLLLPPLLLLAQVL